MDTIKLWARNSDAVRQAIELGELVPEAPALLASMGIYLFRFAVLWEILEDDAQRQSIHH